MRKGLPPVGRSRTETVRRVVMKNVHVVAGLLLLQPVFKCVRTGASVPPNTLEQVPPPFPFPPLPSPPLRSRPPLLRLEGLGEHFSSPSGSGQSPAAKRYLVNFRLKISPLVATIFRNLGGGESALIINALPPKFLQNAPPPYFFHGAFAPSFMWSRRPCVRSQVTVHCGTMYCNQSCLWMWVCLWACLCLWVCYHDNSKLHALILIRAV